MTSTNAEVLPQQKMSSTKKAALWVVGILATAIAGFASDRTQEQLCLKLPSYESMKYPAERIGSIKYSSLESMSTKDKFDGKSVTFRALYMGQSEKAVYSNFISAGQLKGRVVLNTRGLDFTDTTSGPFGGVENQLPSFPVLVPYEIAEQLKDQKKGKVVEFEGVGFSVKPGGSLAAFKSSPEPPDFASFFVQAGSASIIRPLNHPADRVLCRLLHAEKVSSF